MMAPNPDPSVRAADRGERMNQMGSTLSVRADGFDEVLTHDTVLQAWQCGGPLVNLKGHAIGLNIARAGRTASYALPARRVQEIAEALMAEAGGLPPRSE
jgi:serine protease Do